MRAYSDAGEPLVMRMVDCEISLREGAVVCPLLVGHDMKEIMLQNVRASGFDGDAMLHIRSNDLPASAPEIVLRDCEGIGVVRA